MTTRDIAASIQGVSSSTNQAAHAMENVVQGADRAGKAIRNIINEANDIGTQADKLRHEVEQFLTAVQTDVRERRRSERIAGNGVSATLSVPGQPTAKVVIKDLSHHGVSLHHDGTVIVGRDVEIDLPGTGGRRDRSCPSRQDGVVALAFNEALAVQAPVDRTLASLSASRKAA